MAFGSLFITVISGMVALSTFQIFLIVVAPFILDIDVINVYCGFYNMDQET